MKANLKPVRTAAVALVAAASMGSAEIPVRTKRALQERAPEQLQIEIRDVQRRRNASGGFDLEVDARVISVEKSESGLKAGDGVTIRYWMHDPDKPLPPGSYPIEVKEGRSYKACLGPPSAAYRALADKEGKAYFPKAASGSFERVSPSKP